MLSDLQPSSPTFSFELARRLQVLRESESTDQISLALTKLLSGIEDESPFLDVVGQLQVEHIRARKHDEIADLHLLALSRFPNSLSAHLAYAEHLVWFDGDAAKALEVSTRAVSLAKRQNTLVRHALQGKARAAKKLGLYPLFEETLEEILMSSDMGVVGDIRYEIDLVRDLPEGVVNPDVVAEFRHRCRASEHDA